MAEVVGDSWRPGPRQRIFALTEAQQRVAAENVALHQGLDEIQRRVQRVREVCELSYGDALARRILRILDGDH